MAEVVVVTGGSGFLGQHIVKHLLEQKEFPIREVRVFDVRPLKWSHGLEGNNAQVPLRQYQGDICHQNDLQEAFKGATIVIHNASIIDVSTNPDIDKLQRVNVLGSSNVIKSCVSNNIGYLLYTSSVVAGKSTGAYGATKRQAEDLILGANGRNLPNRGTLRSCSLRAATMYGEGDIIWLEALKMLIHGKTFYRLGDDAARFQMAYAGNIAHAFVAAICRLRDTAHIDTNLPNPEGRAVNVADDTPVKSQSRIMEPFAAHVAGAKPSRLHVPIWFLYILAIIFEWFSYLMKPFRRVSLPLSTLGVSHIYQLPIVHVDEANTYLGYSPLYSYETAFLKSIKYYRYAYKFKKG